MLRAAAALSCLLVTLAGPAMPAAQEARPPDEYEVKALYVYQFLRFVEWPDAGGDTLAPLRIGLLHQDPFDGHLQEIVRGRTSRGRTILVEVCDLAGLDSLWYDVVFVSASEMRYASRLLKDLRGAPVLTIGEGEGFLQSGGLINLVRVGSTVKFDVSLAAAERSGLSLGSGLLRVARRVSH